MLDVFDERAGGSASRAEETVSLRKEVARLMPHLYKGKIAAKPGTLHACLTAFARER